MPQLSTSKPRLAANYVLLSGAEFVSKILAALAFAYLARVLGPQSYGYLEFVIAIAFILTLLVDSGLNSYGAREIARGEKVSGRLIIHVTLMRFILAIGAVVLLAIIAMVIDQPPEVKTLILLYALFILAWPGLIQWVFQGRDMMHYAALVSLVRWSLFAFGLFLFVRDESQIWLVPLIEGFAVLCVVAILFGALYFSFGLPKSKIDLRYGFGIFREAFPIGASELLWAVKVYFATIVLGLVIGGADVGYFGSAHRIVISLHAFVWLYFFNLLPSIARSTNEPIRDLQKLMRVSIQTTAWFAIFLGIFCTALASVIIGILYGPQYGEAIAVFQVLIWLIPLALMSGHYRYTLIGYNHQGLEFVSSAGGAVAVILLNLLLIRSVGLIGAAWALVISEVVIWAIAYYFVRQKVAHVPFLSCLGRPLLAGGMVIVTFYFLMPINQWLAAGVAIVIFAVLLLILNPNIWSYRGLITSAIEQRRSPIS